jgi:hypothetical protein
MTNVTKIVAADRISANIRAISFGVHSGGCGDGVTVAPFVASGIAGTVSEVQSRQRCKR